MEFKVHYRHFAKPIFCDMAKYPLRRLKDQ